MSVHLGSCVRDRPAWRRRVVVSLLRRAWQSAGVRLRLSRMHSGWSNRVRSSFVASLMTPYRRSSLGLGRKLRRLRRIISAKYTRLPLKTLVTSSFLTPTSSCLSHTASPSILPSQCSCCRRSIRDSGPSMSVQARWPSPPRTRIVRRYI